MIYLLIALNLVALGMDFGFTNDPTTLVEIWKDVGMICLLMN
jgi:hypothetical protein